MATDSPEWQQTRPMTFEEFLAFEEASPTKHELVAGYVFDWNGGEIRGLAGATRRHNRIAGNIFARLWNAANPGQCQVYSSDMRLRVSDIASYYPDLQVVCDPTDADELFTTRPCLIVEVLSPSTASVDRREKLLEYQSLNSLQAYLIVWTSERRCLLHTRDGEQGWSSAFHGPHGDVALPCPELRLSLDEIYEGVELESPDA
jgi:Uma2 family endonuclease